MVETYLYYKVVSRLSDWCGSLSCRKSNRGLKKFNTKKSMVTSCFEESVKSLEHQLFKVLA